MGDYHTFNDGLPIFYALKLFFNILLAALLVTYCCSLAKADVGLTHQLKRERADILENIEAARNDSVPNFSLIDSLQSAVISIDGRIMVSYDETVARMAAEKRQRGADSQATVYISLILTVIVLLLLALLLMARKRVIASGKTGLMELYRQLTMDFLNSVSADETGNRQLLRVNVVVLVGLTLMSLSVIAFLLRTL